MFDQQFKMPYIDPSLYFNYVNKILKLFVIVPFCLVYVWYTYTYQSL